MNHSLQYIFPIILFMSCNLFAEQTVIPNYTKAKKIFWSKLYPNGNCTIYCGVRFNNSKTTIDDRRLSIEHVYPQSWIARHMGCKNVKECRKNNKKFNYAVADLHNMYPALRNINSSRGNSLYGIIDGESRKYKDCDYERVKGITEPREIARGNLARSIMYMSSEYNLPIPDKMTAIIQKWHKDDPPSAHEHRRNKKIMTLQSTSNNYISNTKEHL